MEVMSSVLRLAALSLGVALASSAVASEETQLVESINAYRSQAQPCAGQASMELPPLKPDPRLILPAGSIGDLQQALSRTAYPLVNVQAVNLSGPRDAQVAMKALQESFCQVVLDPQFVDIGVSREGVDWRIVLARPLLAGGLGDWQVEGQKLLEQINTARTQARQCGSQSFSAAGPLTWNATLAGAAAVVGVDTGLTHLAAALGVPTIGIYGATDPRATGLYARGAAVNRGGLGGFPSVDDVLDALRELVDVAANAGTPPGARPLQRHE